MAQTLPIELCPGVLVGSVPVVLYVAPPAGIVTIRRAVFTNILNAPTLVNVTKILTNGSQLLIVNNEPISVSEQWVAAALANLVLTAGESIQATSSVNNSINAFVSGFQSQ